MVIQQILFTIQVFGVVLGIIGICTMMAKNSQAKLKRTRRVLIDAARRDPLGRFLIRCHRKRSLGTAKVPVMMLAMSFVLFAFSISANLIHARLISLGSPYERFVARERHVDLTNFHQPYSAISNLTDITTLVMANSDVTDESLKFLAKLENLVDLDLRNTQITDEGLRILAQLPKLRYLQLEGTQVTDDGFREHLLFKESIVKIDLTRTSVSEATCAEWSSLIRRRKLILDGKIPNGPSFQKKSQEPAVPAEPTILANKLVSN